MNESGGIHIQDGDGEGYIADGEGQTVRDVVDGKYDTQT